jgi:hypothetical protein
MAKPKSFLKSLSIDNAKRAHNCQHNSKHRIIKGDTRLGLKVERSTEYFCKECSIKFLENGSEEIDMLLSELRKS